MIVYKCKICGCRFAIEKKYIHYQEGEDRYLSCPLDGRHRLLNVVGTEDIKKLMEECKAVEM